RWGLDDGAVMRENGKLVIVHVSGYGASGDPDYAARASYDIVGQAFGGSMYQTGSPEPGPPMRAAPWVGDYTSALFALWSALAGVIHAMKSGRGQTIDLAQYEAIHRTLGGTMVEYFVRGIVRERSGNKAQGFQPLDAFRASDGWVVLAALTDVYDRMLRVIGLDPAEAKWQQARYDIESIEGIEFDAILRGWVNERTVAECVKLMNDARVPCSAIMSSKDAAEDPQYQARETHVQWDDPLAGPVKGVGIVPKFSATPGRIFRGSVGIGHDNQRVYGDLLGLSATEIERLKREKII
ncbi:MAG: CaiB/BaiF CoA transferase family protein, partial [Candidatus Binataceae bacterium]